MNVVVELCVDDIAGIETAVEAGFDRVELCRNLECGGLTPPKSLIMEALKVSPEGGLQILIREQSDSFVLDEEEVSKLCEIISDLRELTEGEDKPVGFVVGAVTSDGEIDVEAARQFREAAGERPLTFHRAFDTVSDRERGLSELISLGYDRILTTGGDRAVAQVDALRQLQVLAGDKLVILGSGGLRSHNVAQVVNDGALREIHMRAPARQEPLDGIFGTDAQEVKRISEAL